MQRVLVWSLKNLSHRQEYFKKCIFYHLTFLKRIGCHNSIFTFDFHFEVSHSEEIRIFNTNMWSCAIIKFFNLTYHLDN